VGNLKIPQQLQFQITTHLNLAFLKWNSETFMGILDLGILRWIRTPNAWGTFNFHHSSNSNHQTSKFSIFEVELKIIYGYFGFGDLKVDKDPPRVGDL
jgi:hypothetical protein